MKILPEAMTVKHKPHRKGPKCHYCHKYGHIQRFCKEREKAAQSTNPKDNSTVNKHHRTTSSVKTSHKVNSASVKKRSDSELDSDKAGLVVKHALSVLETTHESQWIIDSGATSHMCTDRRIFTEFRPLSKSLEVKLGDGDVLMVVGQGTVQLITKCGRDKYLKCTLSDVLYVPKLSCNLLSVSKTTEKGNDVKFYEDTCIIQDVNRKTVAVATRDGGIYHVTTNQAHATIATTTPMKEDIWHRRYGHLSLMNLQKLARKQLVNNFNFSATQEIQFFKSCIQGKQHKATFPVRSDCEKTKEPLDLVHSDVCGKINCKSLSGAEYFLTFVDDKTRYTWVYVLKRKSDVFAKFKEWKAKVERLTGRKLKSISH